MKGIGGFQAAKRGNRGSIPVFGGFYFFSFFFFILCRASWATDFFHSFIHSLLWNFFLLQIMAASNVGLRPTLAAKMMKKAAKQVEGEENRLMHYVH